LICRPEEEEDTAGAGAVDFKGKEVFYMPGFDGTGPMGAGPMTGGGWGRCNPSAGSYATSGFGRGRGFRGGFGRGRGYGRGIGWSGAYPPTGGGYGPTYGPVYGSPYATMKPEDEVNMLKDEADAVKRELDAMQKRIEELESQPSES